MIIKIYRFIFYLENLNYLSFPFLHLQYKNIYENRFGRKRDQ